MFDVCRKEYLDTVAEINDNNSLDTYRGVYLGKIYKRRTEPKKLISITSDTINPNPLEKCLIFVIRVYIKSIMI